MPPTFYSEDFISPEKFKQKHNEDSHALHLESEIANILFLCLSVSFCTHLLS